MSNIFANCGLLILPEKSEVDGSSLTQYRLYIDQSSRSTCAHESRTVSCLEVHSHTMAFMRYNTVIKG